MLDNEWANNEHDYFDLKKGVQIVLIDYSGFRIVSHDGNNVIGWHNHNEN